MTGMQFVDVVALVKREAKGETTPVETEWLYDPANVTIWKEALSAAIDDASQQFVLQREHLDRIREDAHRGLLPLQSYSTAIEGYEMWKKKASRYRLGLEHRLREVKAYERTRNVLATDAANSLMTLIKAIEDHQRETENPSDADRRLWANLTPVALT